MNNLLKIVKTLFKYVGKMKPLLTKNQNNVTDGENRKVKFKSRVKFFKKFC